MQTLLMLLSPLSGATETVIVAPRFDRRLAETPPSAIDIRNVCGSVTVLGERRDSIQLKGTVDSDAVVVVTEAGGRMRIRVKKRDNKRKTGSFCAKLTLSLPPTPDLDIEAVSADLSVTGLSSRIDAETVSGKVTLQGGERMGPVAVHTVSGDVEVNDARQDVQIQTVSGAIRLTRVSGRLGAQSVSGDQSVTGEVSRGDLTSVSGRIELLATLTTGGTLKVQSHSGDVGIVLPSSLDTDVELSSFSGQLLFDGKAISKQGFGPGRSLSARRGKGGADVYASTFSGDLVIRFQ
ncbi:MAG: DUF4097 family beta strand repeat-containing protein [Myxococcota bacterium]